MADWKEKGVVPDSDDEDVLDFQSTASDQEIRNRGGSYEADVSEILGGLGEAQDDDDEVDAIGGVWISPEAQSPPNVGSDVAQEVIGEGTELQGTPVRIPEPNRDLHMSSPLLADVFKFPEPLSDSDEDGNSQSRTSPRNSALDIPEQDEISQSYARITSVNSSPLSSPLRSQLSELDQRRPDTTERAVNSAYNIAHGMLREEQGEPVPQNESMIPPKRSFRPRNAIQLHPYAVEGEKFRQTFKARGLAPVRIAESQQDGARGKSLERSIDPESQEGDSLQVLVESFESHDFEWDPPSSPPRASSPPVVDDVDDEGPAPEDDDYEFPDINELLKHKYRKSALPKPLPKPVNKLPTKHRLQTYSNKFKRPPPVEIVPRKAKSKLLSVSNHERPASPPATSSPTLPPPDLNRSSLTRVSSNASSKAPSWYVEDEGQKVADLPTPATSAMKPQPDQIFVDPLSESDDPFASDPEHLSSAQSSSDETMQLQKVSKTIRGVLPASHLRLDVQSKKLPAPVRIQRQTLSASPVKGVARKGVARTKGHNESNTPRLSNFGFDFLSNSSEDEDAGHSVSRRASPNLPPLASLLDESRIGDAEEEDSIDAMLPARKRQSSGSNHRPYKKHTGSSGQNRRPKITEHLKRPRNSASLGDRPAKRTKWSKASNSRVTKHSARPQRPSPPRLGILDVIDSHGTRDTPQFLKVAARAARSRKGQGRQSPTRKFIRLATREDTQDVQSVLEDWREGNISAKLSNNEISRLRNTARSPLGLIEDNQQTKLPSTQRSRSTQLIKTGPRKLAIASTAQQQSMQNFVTRQPVMRLPPEVSMLKSSLKAAQKSRQRRQLGQHFRPAQLEATETDYSRRNPSAAFISTKKTLDSVYRTARKRSGSQRNLQLNRFLADEDVARPSVETAFVDLNEGPDHQIDHNRSRLSHRQKRPPKRIDAGAAVYRQPSEPLILDYLVREETVEVTSDETKLRGLGKFGTKYTIHFDIFPLQQGIHFHQETLIGSGRLYGIISGFEAGSSLPSSPASLRIDDKVFQWGSWDETASSEVGICFDWLLERLATQAPPSTVAPSAVEVVEFALDFVQHNIRFNGLLTRRDLLTRLLQVVRDFAVRMTKSSNHEQSQIKPLVDVLSTSSVLVFILLRMAQSDPELEALVFEMEDLLKLVASQCVGVLLSEGVGSIRNLYDNLQYLSFRESGIKKDQHAANAWVTLIQILGAASIPRSSFWDIVNSQIPLSCIKEIQDAPALEKLWYTMYTLLPLYNFDGHGIVVPGLRQTSAFDNWPLCQSLLQKVFLCYKSNQRQSPGFNDYCRTIVNRCHYLMTEWTWLKCSGIIGTLFDIFAEQKLSHLRNEEVYHSPHFLEELNKNPSLEVEPEDSCFHIFLKIVALGIKHLSRTKDTKSIRNLVARLLPNHDRQLPKEEVVRRRDLASLRNHHDLLCTLFWTAPAKQRPPISLIQELVIPDRSHNEACLINLRAWENVARFLARGSPDFEAFQPVRKWQSSFFNAVCEQYLEAEHEIRQQAEALERQGGNPNIEATISTTIQANRKTVMVTMCRSINAIASTIKIASTDAMAKQILNSDVLSKALDPAIYNDRQLSSPLLGEVVGTLYNYMDQIDQFCPVNSPAAGVLNEESQDSLGMADVNWGRLEMANSLDDVARNFAPIVKMYMEVDFDERDPTANFQLIDCWARLTAVLAEDNPEVLQGFLATGPRAVFENRYAHKVACDNWPLFLAKIIGYRKSLDGFPPGFNVGLEWLLALTRAQQVSTAETALTFQLAQKGYYLCNSSDVHKSDRVASLRYAIRKMSTLLLEDRTSTEIGIPHRDAKRLFSDMLSEVMKTMQQTLESSVPNSDAHKNYLDFARAVVTEIKCYANEYRPLTEYFVHPSTSYWPHDRDPNLYAAGIISYCVRLGQQSQKTSFELYYYLHGGWKNSLISNNLQDYTTHIERGMKRWDFTRFMLSEFVPAILDAGFTAGGWLLCQSFLPAISHRLPSLLAQLDGNTTWTFELMINILKMIMNGTSMLSQKFGHNIQGVHPDHRGILASAFEFWFSVAPSMRQYVERHPDLAAALEEVTDPLSSFIYNTIQAFSTGELESPFPLPTGQFDVMKGKHTDKFKEVIVQDIHQHWTFQSEGFEVVVMNRGKEKSEVHMIRESLSTVLRGALPGYEALFEDKEGVELPQFVGKMTMEMFF